MNPQDFLKFLSKHALGRSHILQPFSASSAKYGFFSLFSVLGPLLGWLTVASEEVTYKVKDCCSELEAQSKIWISSLKIEDKFKTSWKRKYQLFPFSLLPRKTWLCNDGRKVRLTKMLDCSPKFTSCCCFLRGSQSSRQKGICTVNVNTFHLVRC